MGTVLQIRAGGLPVAQDPLDLWYREISEQTALALKELAFAATAEAFALCKAEFPNYQISHIAGQHRFHKMQYKMLSFGATDPTLKGRQKQHPNGLPFTQLYNDALQITSATVESEHGCPQLSLFREVEQAQQLQFFNETGVLVCHLCVCVEGNLAVPKAVHARFPDGKGGYLKPHVDLTNLMRRPVILPVEPVRENRDVRERDADTDTDAGRDGGT
jgi:hypothetical protein